MNKKGNQLYPSLKDIYNKIADINTGEFGIELLQSFKSYFDKIRDLKYIEFDEIETDVIAEIIVRNEHYKNTLITRELLNAFFTPQNVEDAYENIVKVPELMKELEKPDEIGLNEYLGKHAERLVLAIANAYEWEVGSDIEYTDKEVVFKKYSELKSLYRLFCKNSDLNFAIRILIPYMQEEKLFDWFSKDYIQKESFAQLVDIFKTPKENINYFIRKAKLPSNAENALNPIVRSVFKGK